MQVRRHPLALLAFLVASCSAYPANPESEAVPPPKPLRAPDVRYEPSSHRAVAAMLRLAGVTRDDVVYDLGSGDGRIPIAAARDFGARGVGIEIDPKLVAVARRNARQAGVDDKVTFRNEDIFEANFSDATVVTLFLWPDVNLRLRPKLMATLRPGTRIVSHWHNMGTWQPERIDRVDGVPLYLWRIPAREEASGVGSN